MTRDQHAVRVGHPEAPRQIRRLAPEFAIDEVAEPAEQKAEPRQGRHEIADVGKSLTLDPCEDAACDQHAGHPAVKGHAAVPDMKDVEPILGDHVVAVKNAPTDPAADDDADGAVKNEIIDIEGGPGRPRLLRAVSRQPPRGDKTDEVHEAVPVNAQGSETEYRTDRDGNGVDMRIREHAPYFKLSFTRQKLAFKYRVSGMAGCTGWSGACPPTSRI